MRYKGTNKIDLVTFMFAVQETVFTSLHKRKIFRYIQIFPYSALNCKITLKTVTFKGDFNEADVL